MTKSEQKIPKKRGRKPKKKMYFGMEVQDAIVRYNALDQQKKQGERNKIYQEEIHAAFDKLSENIINTFKFTYFDYGFEDVKAEVVAFMVMNMHKYDHTKGSKAFSYFSVVAKNYLILHNNNNYKKLKMHKSVDVLQTMSSTRDKEVEEDMIHLTNELVEYFEDNITNIFSRKKDIDIAYAILELFKKRDEIENFNKKSLYILIREMTNVNTIHITSVVNTLKKHYYKLSKQYFANGRIDDTKKTLKNKFF